MTIDDAGKHVSAYNAVTIFRVNESGDMAPCSTLTLKVSAAYTKMSEEQKHKMWLTPTAKITKYLQLAKPKDKKHNTSCTLTDRIQLNVISFSKFITLTCDISHLIIYVLVQCVHYGCTCCDCCKLMNKVPISVVCYSICDESMKLIKRLIWYIHNGSNLLRSSLVSELSRYVTSLVH